MAFRASATILTLSGGKENYGSGPNSSRANAIAELGSILATVVGQGILKLSVTEDADPTTEGLALFATTGEYEDAVIVVKKAGPLLGQTLYKTITVENMTLTLKVSDPNSNHVDGTQSLITAIVSNYHDGLGNGGYAFVGGDDSYFKN